MSKRDQQIDKLVLAYLKKRGYSHAEHWLRQEAKGIQTVEAACEAINFDAESSIVNSIMFFSNSENNPAYYFEKYSQLCNWVYESLDRYKNELVHILYPIFIHLFFRLVSKGFIQEAQRFVARYRSEHRVHSDEIEKIIALSTPQLLQESELPLLFLKNKYMVRMCQYSFDLLVSYLHSTKSLMILAIVNQHLDIQVTPGQPADAAPPVHGGIVGDSTEAVEAANRRPIQWPPTPEPEPEEPRPAHRGRGRPRKDESTTERKYPLQAPKLGEVAEAEIATDAKYRAPLTTEHLPSICMFTYLNTHNLLNTVNFSADGSLMCAGCGDSSVHVWDLTPNRVFYKPPPTIGDRLAPGLQPRPRDLSWAVQGLGGAPSAPEPDEPHPGSLDSGTPTVSHHVFVGHSGPVYKCCFSTNNQYILSCSEDGTLRMWSHEIKAPLVAYKGHTYPVWDCAFSPLQYYFASASHDRTARIWVTDRVDPVRILVGHLADVNCVSFHPNSLYLGTGSEDRSVRLWDVHTGETVRIYTGHSKPLTAIAFAPDGRTCASADSSGEILLWDLVAGKLRKPLHGHTRAVWSLDFAAEGNLLASSSADQSVRLWDMASDGTAHRALVHDDTLPGESTELLRTYPTKSTPVLAARFTRRNALLAAGPYRNALG
eukprot:gnl/Trimastix_PCT/2781.p1 GENE.gnl/Trimastix_PCT/2781~~gnl/Trimastix_PCT/2781.p1  ORF type:complete len:655 (+),score=178.70 gnl/Trimastix_PCT/2781:56-2020(+)